MHHEERQVTASSASLLRIWASMGAVSFSRLAYRCIVGQRNREPLQTLCMFIEPNTVRAHRCMHQVSYGVIALDKGHTTGNCSGLRLALDRCNNLRMAKFRSPTGARTLHEHVPCFRHAFRFRCEIALALDSASQIRHVPDKRWLSTPSSL